MTTMDDGSALEDGDKFDEHENDYEYEHGEDKCNEYDNHNDNEEMEEENSLFING